MANSTNSLSHTKWLCKYHIVIVSKYRRKIIYNQYRKDLQDIIRTLCRYKGVEMMLNSTFFSQYREFHSLFRFACRPEFHAL